MSLKSTFSNSTSKSYALALYELAKDNSDLDQVEIGIKNLKELLKNSSDFKIKILCQNYYTSKTGIYSSQSLN